MLLREQSDALAQRDTPTHNPEVPFIPHARAVLIKWSMLNEKDRYRPRRIEEIEDDGVSLINEPVAPDNVHVV
jgi:hypothetical protein